MQGRLSNKGSFPLQSFPSDTWAEEFIRAKKLGFSKIEWLIDKNNDYNNPLYSKEGRGKIIDISDQSGIKIDTLCAHFLIDGKILKKNQESENVKNFFFETIQLAPLVGIKFISIPLIEDLSLKNKVVFKELKNLLKEVTEKFEIEILIETDLKNYENLNFIKSIGSDNINILLDTGNLTKNNFDFQEEFTKFHKKIKEIHIKDYSLKEKKSVRLGSGDTDLVYIFNTLKRFSWEGHIIFETPIFENWYAEAISNLNHIKNID